MHKDMELFGVVGVAVVVVVVVVDCILAEVAEAVVGTVEVEVGVEVVAEVVMALDSCSLKKRCHLEAEQLVVAAQRPFERDSLPS